MRAVGSNKNGEDDSVYTVPQLEVFVVSNYELDGSLKGSRGV